MNLCGHTEQARRVARVVAFVDDSNTDGTRQINDQKAFEVVKGKYAGDRAVKGSTT